MGISFQDILNYIDSHPDTVLSVRGISAHFEITPQYLCRLFKKNLDMTCRQYINSKISKNKPKEYSFYHTVSPDFSRLMKNNWHRLINLGYASQLEGQHMVYQIRILQKQIHFDYGRICRITDLLQNYSAQKHYSNDYATIFTLFDLMIDNQLRPLLELGYKIFYIQQNTAEYYTGPSESIIDYYDSILKILPDFLRACINRYGQNELDRWAFEISYPYIMPGTRQILTFPHFVTYYQKIFDIIRSFSSKCKIGGPGFNDWFSDGILETTLYNMKSVSQKPDFFSAYSYCIEKDIGISEDADLLQNRIQRLSDKLRNDFPDAKLWITEFNSNLSSRNHLNDSSYQSAFLVKNLLENNLSKADALGYYLLSDHALRYSDSLEFLFGGWGLFTDSNIRKPSFFAYQMISYLGNYIVDCGKGYFITADSSGSIQVLLYHFEQPVPEYRTKNITLNDLKSDITFWNSDHINHHYIHFTEIPCGLYMIKKYDLSSVSSSLLYEWSKVDYISPLQQDDMEDLERLSDLVPTMFSVRTNKDTPLCIDCSLSSNQTVLFTINFYNGEPDNI